MDTEDAKAVKPYLKHLAKQITALEPQIAKLVQRPLDEQLILIGDEQARLKLSNAYAYVIASLMFSYMKINGTKDMAPIMAELDRVRGYMQREKSAVERATARRRLGDSEKEQLRSHIQDALGKTRHSQASISAENFAGKHTRFEDKHYKITK